MIALPPSADLQVTDNPFQNERFRQPAEIHRAFSLKEPSPESLQTFPLRQKFLALSRSRKPLRFLSEAQLHFDNDTKAVTVEGWGVSVDASIDGIASVPRQMARQFLRLWQDAEHQRLSESDLAYWRSIVRQVDMDAFHRSLERPRYLEAQLAGERLKPIVRWPAENKISRVPEQFRSEFALTDRGEFFGAYFILDENQEIVSVEGVVPIPPPSEKLFDAWPPVM